MLKYTKINSAESHFRRWTEKCYIKWKFQNMSSRSNAYPTSEVLTWCPASSTCEDCQHISVHMPSSLKSATLTPLLKKSILNHEDLKKYKPVSNLTYISKLIEKSVVRRLNAHMTQNYLHEYY